MITKLVSGPSQYPVTLDEVKADRDIPTYDATFDSLLKRLIAQATEKAEKFTGRKLVSQTWQLYLDDWPDEEMIKIPFGQLQSVSSVKYKDTDGNQSTWGASNYIVRTGDYGLVVQAYGINWPTTQLYPIDAIEVEFVCGYYAGSEWTADTAKSSGDIVIPTNYQNPFAYSAGGSGTTDSIENEPVWPTTIGGTVVDNDITWTNLGLGVPESIRGGIIMAVAGASEMREPHIEGLSFQQLKSFESLLWGYRHWQ